MNIDEAYSELEVTPGTSQDECRKSYRRLISEWHPDRNKSEIAHQKSQQINRAWHVLEKAGFPSRENSHSSNSSAHGRSSPWGQSTSSETQDDIYGESDFRDFRTSGGYAFWAKQGKHVKRTARVSLEEANNGFIYEFEATIKDPCVTCAGQKTVGQPIYCAACRGSGVTGARYYGTYCTKCNGQGSTYQVCGTCSGTGVGKHREVKQQVRIRPGMRSGDTMLVRGLGGKSPDRDGPNGDLTISVSIKDHPIFFFNEDIDDMLCTVIPITLLDLMCGGSVDVPTLYGMKTISVTPKKLIYEIKDAGYNGLKGREPLLVRLDVDFEPLAEQYRDILVGARDYMRKNGLQESNSVSAWKAEVAEWMNPTKPARKSAKKKSRT